MIGVAGSAKIVSIPKVRGVPTVLFNVEFCSNDVVNIYAQSATFTQNADLAERISSKHDPPRALSPSPFPAVIKRFQLRAASYCIAFPRFPKLAIIQPMRNAIASAIWDQNSALRTDRGRLGRHGVIWLLSTRHLLKLSIRGPALKCRRRWRA